MIKSAWATDNAIRDEGWDAFNKGLQESDNPYKYWKGQGEEQQYEDWKDGWEAAYYESTYLNSSRQITSVKSQEEFENLVIDIENRLGVNVEHSNIFNLPVELTYEDECYIDDICREQNCRFVPVNGSRRQYRLIQSSRRIQSMRTPKNVYLNEDTQKLIQRLEKRVGHELKLKFEEGNTPYVEIEKLPKGGYSFITKNYLNKLAEHFLYDGYKEKQDSFIVYLDPAIMYTKPGIESAYTREDYDRFDEVGNFIPYKPTEEELAKKDEIKKVLEQELSAAYEPDPRDDYVGYDSTDERIDMACERVAKQFGVDTDFVEEIAGEIQNEENTRQYEEVEWAEKNLKGDEYDKWYRGELDVRPLMLKNSRQIKSSFISSSLSDILQDKEALQYFTVEELQKMNYNEWLLKKITADEHTENDSLIAKLYKEHMLKSSRQIKSSNDMSLNEFCDNLNTDPDYKEEFKDWVREGPHGSDILSYDRWMEQFDDFAGTFDSNEEKEITEFDVEVGDSYDDKEIIHVEKIGPNWKSSDGKSFMGYLEPQDVVTWLRKDYGRAWIDSSRKQIKSSIITPWDVSQVTGTSDEDLGLSAVVDIYGNEFVNVDESTLNKLKDTLVRYFDDEAYVRDWNINYPNDQIEDAFDVTDPEEMDVEDLARYFDYEAYGRDIRLEDNMVWDSENQYWISAHDVDDEELNNDKYIFMRG